MRRLLLFIAVGVLAGCGSASIGSSESGSSRIAARTTPVNDEKMVGLTRVGDVPKTDSRALALQCSDEQSCWIISPRMLWHSSDGGSSWTEIYQVPKDDETESCDFINRDTGWRLSSQKVYKTQDGGRTWTQQPSPLDYPNGDIRSTWFLGDGRNGWLAGGLYRPQTSEELKNGVPNNTRDSTGKKVLEEAIFRTTDGGQSWRRQSLPLGLLGRVMRIRFLNSDQGIALGEGSAYRIGNGGDNWEPITFKKNCVRKEYLSDRYEAQPYDVAMLDSKAWWVTYNDGRIIKSFDGGRSWCDLVHPGRIAFEEVGQRFFTKMHFDSATHGLALGWDRFLYETKDGGSTWAKTSSDIGFDDIAFPTNTHAVLLSDKGVYTLVF